MDQAGLDRLIRRARKHDPEALSALVDTYGARVFGLLYRMTGSRDTAEDLLQETFLRVVRMIGQYEHTGRFEAWLFRIAANLVRDRARRAKHRGRTLTLDGLASDGEAETRSVPDGSQPDPGQKLADKEAGERLDAALKGLSEMDREIVLLRHFSELSFKEIADVLQIPLGTALARAHRALKRLRAELGDEV